ncbi:small heat shock protein [Weissella oryzae SG25]|uniref:Small heat shock protein n=1 Tax=Weissella oryzae (strain DSM 25784 / JCM 18191 / LMG 30913 / SG25) TaxID=1329250 RepID=A0A069CS67_WEIOS|nr:Hsp20/alpha crystallin family protein [Weissella oryzae]GAK30237.1 small heat shock protein [Weissella oryzae SG25]
MMANELLKNSWNPFDAFDMDFFGNTRVPRRFMNTDISDEGSKYLVSVELPGLQKENVNLSFDDNVLTISTEKHEIADHGHGDLIQSERSSEAMSRSFRFSNIDEDNISAEYKNGVLKVELPKQNEDDVEGYHKIEIN